MYTIKKILVPTDFSENASTAYHPAQQLAQKYGAVVDFIHISPSKNYFSESIVRHGITLDGEQGLYSKVQGDVSAQLQKIMDDHIKPENHGRYFVKAASKPSKAIAEKAMSGEYDLIVMAAKGSHANDFWAGSTTRRVIRYSKIPVFSTQQFNIDGLRNILVPIDGTPESLQALPLAISIAGAFNAKITLYNVIVLRYVPLEGAADEIPKATYQQIQEEVFNKVKTFFADSGGEFRLQKNEEDKTLIYHQDNSSIEIEMKTIVERRISKYEAITTYARQKADIIIMATHGHRGFSYLLFGSVAEEVAHELKLPVVTVQMNSFKPN